MIDRIKEFFNEQLRPDAGAGARDPEHALRLAAAALLVEMSRADMHIRDGERAAIETGVRDVFGLGEAETRSLVALAEEEVHDATSMYGFTRLINDGFSAGQKARIVELMWRVAYADGHLEKHEQHLMRKIAGLLYIPHETYIAAKFRAREEAGTRTED
jgi:uncharacterized tellurite resistance protein B-like protein